MRLKNLEVLVEDDIGLSMKLIPTNDKNASTPENVPKIQIKGKQCIIWIGYVV